MSSNHPVKEDKYLDGEQIVWDVSSLKKFQKCPRRYYLTQIEGWRPKIRDVAPNWGTAVHDSLELYDKLRLDGMEYEEAVMQTVEYMLSNPWYLQNPEIGEEASDNRRTLWTAIRAIVWYTTQYRDDVLKTATMPNGDAALEIRFELPVEGTKYRLSGRIDKIVWKDNDLFLLDRKTTKSTLSSWYFNDFETDIQMTAYLWAAKQMGVDASGFLIEGIQAAVDFNRIQRASILKSDAQIEEFEKELRLTMQEAENCHKEGFWRTGAGCAGYAGCDMHGICGKPPSLRKYYLEEYYQHD